MTAVFLRFAPCVVLCLSACAGGSVGPEVKGLSEAITNATAPMEQTLVARTAGEEAAAQRAAIAAGREVYDTPDACVSAASLTPGTNLGDCRLIPLNTAPVAANSAKAMLAYIRTLRAYAAMLSALATTDAPKEIGEGFGDLLTATEGLAGTRPEFAGLKATIGKTRLPLGSLAGQLAEAERARLIRNLVRDAGPALEDITDRLVAYSEKDDGIHAGAVALTAAYGRMEDARRSGNAAGYGRAVAAYEAANADLQQRIRSSNAGRLVLIGEAQKALRARLEKPQDLEGLVTLIETIKALTDALQS